MVKDLLNENLEDELRTKEDMTATNSTQKTVQRRHVLLCVTNEMLDRCGAIEVWLPYHKQKSKQKKTDKTSQL
jgi:hypothetical protein